MPRVKSGVTAHARHKKILKLAKGYRGARSKHAGRRKSYGFRPSNIPESSYSHTAENEGTVARGSGKST